MDQAVYAEQILKNPAEWLLTDSISDLYYSAENKANIFALAVENRFKTPIWFNPTQ